MDLVLLIVAALPAIVLMVYIYKKDGVEKEPGRLLIRLCFLGCVSIIPTLICELVLDAFFSSFLNTSTIFYLVLDNFIGVALIEEGWKFIFLRTVWNNKAFDYVFDGIVYAVFVSLGFALVENIMYVVEEATYAEALELAGTRALLSVPLHAFCGVFMGFYFGHAKLAAIQGDSAKKNFNLTLAVLVPVFIHGFYDFCLSTESDLFTLVFFIFVIAIYVSAFKRIKASSKADEILEEKPAFTPAPARPIEMSFWGCPQCGTLNEGNFCTECGAKKPLV